MTCNCRFASQTGSPKRYHWTTPCASPIFGTEKDSIPKTENCISEKRFCVPLRQKCLASKTVLIHDWQIFVNSCRYKRWCKHKKINFSVQKIRETLRMMNYSLLHSCVHHNHFKQGRKCLYNITILACFLCYCLYTAQNPFCFILFKTIQLVGKVWTQDMSFTFI